MNNVAQLALGQKKVEREVVRHSKNARTRKEWADRITREWQDSQLNSIFQTGLSLETAKAELKHGDWLAMIKSDLPFKARTAEYLMVIANDDNLRDSHWSANLPVGWGILRHLTGMDEKTFADAIAAGLISPKMTQKDALTLRGKKSAKSTKPTASSKVSPIDRCAMLMRETVLNTLDEVASDQWDALLADLRSELTDIEKIIEERRKGEGE